MSTPEERRQIERDRAEAEANGDPLASQGSMSTSDIEALWDKGEPRRFRGTLSPAMVAKIRARGASRKRQNRA